MPIYVDSEFAEDLISRKSTAGLVAQGENGPALKSSTALSVGEASSERWRSGTFLEINLHGLWSSDGHRVIERLLDSRITDGSIWVLDLDRNTLTLLHMSGCKGRAKDGELSVKKVPTMENCEDTGTKPVSSQLLRNRKRIYAADLLVPRAADHGGHRASVLPVPQINEDMVEVIQPVPREGIRERTLEKIGVFPAPQIGEETVEAVHPVLQEAFKIASLMQLWPTPLLLRASGVVAGDGRASCRL